MSDERPTDEELTAIGARMMKHLEMRTAMNMASEQRCKYKARDQELWTRFLVAALAGRSALVSNDVGLTASDVVGYSQEIANQALGEWMRRWDEEDEASST